MAPPTQPKRYICTKQLKIETKLEGRVIQTKESSHLVSSSTDASNQQPENPEEKEPLNDEVVSRNLKPKN